MVLGNAMFATLLLSTPTPDAAVGPAPHHDDGLDDLLGDLDEADHDDDSDALEQSPFEHESEEFPTPSEYDYDDHHAHHHHEMEAPEERWDGGLYWTMGLAPMSTLHDEGFHPGLRFDFETGMAWARGRAKIQVGPDVHIMQYYGRKKPGFSLDAMATLSLKHVYARVGAGTATRIPAYRDINDTRPMMGGLVGGGVVGRIGDVEGRLGVDYDIRMDTTGRVAQTVLVAMRISFGP